MFAHAQRAIVIGAKMTATVGFIAALCIAAWESAFAKTTGGATFIAAALQRAPAGLLCGALLGAILFGLIGFCVALLGVKRVGWTFTYTLFGAALFALAAFWLQPIVETTGIAVVGQAAIAAAALIGAISGCLVANRLKDVPDV